MWVGFGNEGIFHQLKDSVDRALEECGISRQDQPFRAHLTLGRIRSVKDTQRLNGVIEEFTDRFREEVLIDRLVFYRSELGSGGPVYTPLKVLEFSD